MKKIIKIKLVTLAIVTFFSTLLYSSSIYTLKNEQSEIIKKVIKNETSIKHLKEIYSILENLDNVYSNLYDKLKKGSKITVFFDPAHGKLKSGEWQGAQTWRNSTLAKPEEFYSIQISRKIYNLLNNNPYINVQTTDDYMEVLKGNSDEYKNIPFSTTIELAKKHNAFIIISEHLNNINPVYKADGLFNIPGFHITCNKFGKWTLSYIKKAHRGYLTLYNKLDASSFSRNFAENLKETISDKGLVLNNWEQGAVGDDRFSYFVNYPMSVIFENGFISNPEEENLLVDEDYQTVLAESQYNSFLKTLTDIFGIDISDGEIDKEGKEDKNAIDLLKLSRLSTYYIKENNIDKALSIINEIEKNYNSKKYEKNTAYFFSIQNHLKIIKDKKLIANKYSKRKTRYFYKKACSLLREALNNTKRNPLFYSIRKDIIDDYNKIAKKAKIRRIGGSGKNFGTLQGEIPKTIDFSNVSRKHYLEKPFFITYYENEKIEEAVLRAIKPKQKYKNKIVSAFSNPKIISHKWVKRYSKKRKKNIWIKILRNKKVSFYPGLYIVKLNSKFKLTKVERVGYITFSPKKYQNQHYFKNSCLATNRKIKEL